MADPAPIRIAFVLPGFHRVDRGAEVALLSVAEELGRAGHAVTVIGAGVDRPGRSYRFVHVPAIARERFERFPSFPPLRSDVMWEDMTFAAGLLARMRPADYDVVVTCSFPFTHLAIGRGPAGHRPARVFVTQNGDWPARAGNSEYRLFSCDGLVCTNPDYLAANRDRWTCALIPNGVDLPRFTQAAADRAGFGLPADRPIVLMVSAMIESKRVADGIRAVADLPDAHLVVAGDGPLRDVVSAEADRLLPGRFTRLSVPAERMPALYRSADAFLHMSLFESFGNVFVEAMASGLPIIGHDTPRLRWVVGDGPFLCDTQQQAALVGAIGAALRQGRGAADPAVGKYDWPVIALQYEAFFRQLVANRGRLAG